MNPIHVGIGAYGVSNDPNDLLKTFALGSCVAVVVYDRFSKIAALMHVALPDSSINPERAERDPGYFVDTGLPCLLDKMELTNGRREGIWIKIAGGSNIMDEKGRFDIGKRNVLAIKKYLWKKRLGIVGEDTGGGISRTVSVSVDTGRVVVSSGSKAREL
jgi:chemotaxis protein CheD